MPFFSVIVPAYNSAEYIRKGLDSIKEQVFTDYELIIVCDSCTDNTEEIAREYTDKVYVTNCGSAGGARNVGIDNATGEWILFMDDDDWWLHDYAFQFLAANCKRSKNDAVAYGFIYRLHGYGSALTNWIAVWTKAWRRSFLNSKPYRFPSILLYDDVKFMQDVSPHLHLTRYEMPLYYYNYGRKGSVTVRKLEGELKEEDKRDYKFVFGVEKSE